MSEFAYKGQFSTKFLLKMHILGDQKGNFKCGENRNHGKFKIYFLMVEL